MYISLWGLGMAAFMFAGAFGARFIMLRQLEAADAESRKNPDTAAREREMSGRKIIRTILNADLVILPVIGYFAGTFLDAPR